MKKSIQFATIIMQCGILAAFLLPASSGYGQTGSLLEYIVSSFKDGKMTIVLAGALYYITALVGLLFTALLESKFRYACALMSASVGITLVCVQFIFPALQETYLFAAYQIGIYLLLGCQILTIIFSCAGICAKEAFRPSLSLLESRQDTEEFAPITSQQLEAAAAAVPAGAGAADVPAAAEGAPAVNPTNPANSTPPAAAPAAAPQAVRPVRPAAAKPPARPKTAKPAAKEEKKKGLFGKGKKDKKEKKENKNKKETAKSK